MFTRLLAVLPLALLVVANAHLEARGTCDAKYQYCCNSIQKYDDESTTKYYKEAGISADIAKKAGTFVGLDCTAVSLVPVASQQCNTQNACCQGKYYENVGLALSCFNLNA